VDAVLDNTIGPADYERDDAWAAEVLEHFRISLHRIVDIARKHGAGVVLVTPASNLADCSPFKSDGTGADEAYREGKSLLVEGEYEAAKAAFVRARDLDVCPLRAPSVFIEAVRDVARERDVPLVDFVALTEEAAEHGIPGRKEFLDHVHPTIAGHRRIALALVDMLIDRGVATPCAEWGEAAIARVSRRVEGYVNRETHGRALRQLSKVLGWGGKFEESRWLALQALEFLPDDPESLFQVGAYSCILGDYEDAEEYLRRAIAANPTYGRAHLWLARTLNALGRHEEAEVSQRDAMRFLPGEDLDFVEPKGKAKP
jgi:tetratricopeptide (TPR) repeat protein